MTHRKYQHLLFLYSFPYHWFPFTTGISGNNLWLSVLMCTTSPLYPSSWNYISIFIYTHYIIYPSSNHLPKIAFCRLVLIEIIDNGRHRSWKLQNPRIWSLSNPKIPFISEWNAEAVRDEALEGFWFKQSWLILQAKNWSCCLDNAE